MRPWEIAVIILNRFTAEPINNAWSSLLFHNPSVLWSLCVQISHSQGWSYGTLK